MLNKNQDQVVTDGATAIQAGSNVIIINNNSSGPTLSDIRDTCLALLRDNFPKLREEARVTAEGHVKAFADHLETTLANNVGTIIIDKLRDPDVQATINDAVQAAARKGPNANPDILANLILEKVSGDANGFRDIVYSEAVKVAPRLTREHVAYLAFVLAINEFKFQNSGSLEDLEKSYNNILFFSRPGFGLPERQIQYLQYAGAALVTGANAVTASRGGVTYESVRSLYAEHGWDPASFRQKVPSLGELVDAYNKNKVESVSLNSVGRAIALAYMSNFMGRFDHSPWLY